MTRDYAGESDPYGIAREMTAQSAAQDTGKPAPSTSTDVRGNTLLRPRSVPTQEEADEAMQ